MVNIILLKFKDIIVVTILKQNLLINIKIIVIFLIKLKKDQFVK